MSHRYITNLTLSIPGVIDHEKTVRIDYSRIKGSAQTSLDPGSADHVQIDGMLIFVGGNYVAAGWLEDILREDEDLLTQLMQHWIDDDDHARDRRDEDRMQALRDEARA